MKEEVKTYDEALERAKSEESKDEKIRKTILSHFKSFKQWACGNGVSKEDCIAWLEKQGEQNTELDFEALDDIKRASGIFKKNDIGEISGNTLDWVAESFYKLGLKKLKN